MAEELGVLAEGLGEVAEHVAVVDNRGGIEHGGVADGAGADVAEDDLAQLILGVAEIRERLEGDGAEQIRLQRLHRIQRLLGAGLIHLLDRLERQHHVADRVRLAVPDQLLLAFLVAEAGHPGRWGRRVVYGALLGHRRYSSRGSSSNSARASFSCNRFLAVSARRNRD